MQLTKKLWLLSSIAVLIVLNAASQSVSSGVTFTTVGAPLAADFRVIKASDSGHVVVGRVPAVDGSPSDEDHPYEVYVWDEQLGFTPTGLQGDDFYPVVVNGIADDHAAFVGSRSYYDGFDDVIEGFRWSDGTILESSIPSAISADGNVVVGTGVQGGFRWEAASGGIGFGQHTSATAVSSDGRVVAGILGDTIPPFPIPWIWSAQGEVQPLDGRFVPTFVSSDESVVIGERFDEDLGLPVVYRWTPVSGTEEINYFRCIDIEDAGATVLTDAGLLWTLDRGLAELQALELQRIASGGKTGLTFSGELWTEANGAKAVVSILQEHGIDITSWQSLSPQGISDDGNVVLGIGTNPDGLLQGWRMTIEDSNPTPGDTNADGQINLEDLNNVRNNFGGVGLGDANHDGSVDLEDLNAVRNNFGGSNAVPEPRSLLILAVGAVGLVMRRYQLKRESQQSM